MARSSRSGAPWKPEWLDAHNNRRRDRYMRDGDYRDNRLAESRESYREKNGVMLFSCLDRIPRIQSFANTRPVVLDDGRDLGMRFCFTMTEFAEIVGDHKPSVVYRWRSKGQIPDPIAQASITSDSRWPGVMVTQSQAVYLLEEVYAMMGVIGEHQKRVRYFRETDVDTIEKVRAAVEYARGTL